MSRSKKLSALVLSSLALLSCLAAPTDVESPAEPLAQVSDAVEAGQGDVPLDGDHALTEVEPRWNNVPFRVAQPADGHLDTVIFNHGPNPQRVRLVLVASGLDGKLATTPMAEIELAGESTHEVKVAIANLPIQSQVSASFVVLQAEIDREDGTIVRVPTAPLYYRFGKDYSEATFLTEDEVTDDGGVFTDDLFEVRGRVRGDDGVFHHVEPIDLATAKEPVQGLGGMFREPIVDEPTDALNDNILRKQSATVMTNGGVTPSTVRLCSTWRVQYIDSGYGEDVAATSAWQDVPAKFAPISIVNPSAPTVIYWKGNLDVDGCAFIPLITGSYQLRQYTNNLTDGSVKTNTYRRTADGLVSWGVYANFFIPLPPGFIFINTTPTANNDAVQVQRWRARLWRPINTTGVWGTSLGITVLSPTRDVEQVSRHPRTPFRWHRLCRHDSSAPAAQPRRLHRLG